MSHPLLAGQGSDLQATLHPGHQIEDHRHMRHQGEIPTGRDHGISDAPGLLQQEAGKEMDGRSMRKIVEYLPLVELLFRLSTAGCQS